MPHETHNTSNAEMQQCIRECLDCYATCTATAAHCLKLAGDHAQPKHQAILTDCAKVCLTSADFMLRESPQHHKVCAMCAEVCRVCETTCERDAMMQQCAEACRRCAESCDRMANAVM